MNRSFCTSLVLAGLLLSWPALAHAVNRCGLIFTASKMDRPLPLQKFLAEKEHRLQEFKEFHPEERIGVSLAKLREMKEERVQMLERNLSESKKLIHQLGWEKIESRDAIVRSIFRDQLSFVSRFESEISGFTRAELAQLVDQYRATDLADNSFAAGISMTKHGGT